MDLILAILLWLGLIAPGQTPTDELIDANRSAIEQASQDEDFLRTYMSESIVTFDNDEGL